MLPIFLNYEVQLLAIDSRSQDQGQLSLYLFVGSLQNDLSETFDLAPFVQINSLSEYFDDIGIVSELVSNCHLFLTVHFNVSVHMVGMGHFDVSGQTEYFCYFLSSL